MVKRPNLGGGLLRLTRPMQAARGGAGLRLLREAAVACQRTSYRGEQVMLWWGPGETSASVVDVWHQPDQVTLVQSAAALAGNPAAALSGGAAAALSGSRAAALSGSPAGTAISGPAGNQDPDSILCVSNQLLVLLESNYQVVYAGRGSAAGRKALVVVARRLGGGLAARFWLDATTKLPLRREIFASGAHLVSEDGFISLQLGASGLGAMPEPAVAPWTARLDQARLLALRASGWPVPAQLPGNLVLFSATETSTRSGRVINLSYSDGLAVVSVFVQRGELGHPMRGWRQIGIGGQAVYSINPDERSYAWSSGGFVYTVIADAPVATVSQVVAAMPSTTRPGFWGRMAHGFHRLASWLNPVH
jgi:sigma-E factor negative regulatory protein RseB